MLAPRSLPPVRSRARGGRARSVPRGSQGRAPRTIRSSTFSGRSSSCRSRSRSAKGFSSRGPRRSSSSNGSRSSSGDAPAIAFVEFGVGSGVISGSLCRRHPGWRGVRDRRLRRRGRAREGEFRGARRRRRAWKRSSRTASGRSPRSGAFDLLVANPPYVPTAEIPSLDAEVSRYEARAALDGGADGAGFLPRARARRRCASSCPGGLVAFEIGHGQGDAALEMCARAGLERASMRRDLQRARTDGDGLCAECEGWRAMDRFVIKGPCRLEGRVAVSGAKNAVLPLMAASMLTGGTCTLENVPDLRDTRTMMELLEGFGVASSLAGGSARDRRLADHVVRGAVRSRAHDAGVDIRVRAARRALREGARLDAGRVRVGAAPRRSAPQGARARSGRSSRSSTATSTRPPASSGAPRSRSRSRASARP